MKTRNSIPPLKKRDGTEAISDKEKAEPLNSFFISTFTDERLNDLPSNLGTPSLENLLDSFEITPEIVLENLNALNPGKSPGPDGWHPFFLKKCS